MLRPRVMPCLLLQDAALVKTIRFKDPAYVGDPMNAIRIFNEKEVDELLVVDIQASPEKRDPPYQLISEIASECFMPLNYGGGIRTLEQIGKIFGLGVEKVSINSYALENPSFVKAAADQYGSQSIVVSMDVKRTHAGYEVYSFGGRRATGLDPVSYVKTVEQLGAGEILLNSIDRDGTMEGYDIELIRAVTRVATVPVVALGGAGSLDHFKDALAAGASAVAAGSMVVYHGRGRAVLINFPDSAELQQVIG